MTRASREATVLTARSPGDLVGLVPQLVGCVPTESLVVVSLRGPRSRVGLTLRADLCDLPGLVGQVVEALARDGARAAAVMVHTAAPSGALHPGAALVDELRAALAARGTEVTEALLVRDGRWWSFSCRAGCCPPDGTPIDRVNPLVTAVASAAALGGRAVLASRDDLVASLAPQLPLGHGPARRLQAQAVGDLDRRWRRDPGATERRELRRWRQAVDTWEQQPGGVPAGTAELAAGLHRVGVRDVVAAWGLDRSDPLLGLLHQLCRAVVPPHDAPLCSVLAWVAYAQGNGALALVALERALATDPTYSLARLLRAALEAMLPPAQVRAVLRRVR